MSQSNIIPLPAGARERIEAAVEAAFAAQISTTMAFSAIPSTRSQEAPCQDMMARLLRERGYEVDDWIINQDDLKDLPGYGPVETDFSRARTVVGTYRPTEETGRSLILQGHCDVVPAGPLDMWKYPPFKPTIEDGWLYGRGAGDMKSGTIAALYALDALKAAGLAPKGRVHLQSVIEEESTGLGALSTLQRGYRADACLIPEPTDGKLMRAQVGVIWFRLKVKGVPVHVARAGTGSNAIKAAYHLIQAVEGLEAEWNERAKSHRFFGKLNHPLNFNPGIIKGGDWASSVPAWCDVDCRIGILPGWKIADCQAEIVACVEKAAKTHPFLADNAPEVVWSGFLSPGYEVTGAQDSEAVLAAAYEDVFGGPLEDASFTGLTDTRFYGLDYDVPAFCFGARMENAHGFDERVELESVKKVTKTLALFIAGWCGVEKHKHKNDTGGGLPWKAAVRAENPLVHTPDDLRGHFGQVNPLAEKKVLHHLDKFCRDFIALSPFLVLASSDGKGNADASPRGDGPGFVAVLDDKSLLIPDRRGNNRVDTFGNILASPGVGLIFMVPGINETLRINGKAEITQDPALLTPLAVQNVVPTIGLKVHVDECYFHCGKALMRSKLWDAKAQVERHSFPTLGRIIAEQTTAVSVEVAEKTMEEGYRTRLY